MFAIFLLHRAVIHTVLFLLTHQHLFAVTLNSYLPYNIIHSLQLNRLLYIRLAI